MIIKQLKNFFFHKQTFLLLPLILFLWYTVDALYSYTITVKDLVSHTGKIVLIDTAATDMHKKPKSISYRIIINTESNKVFKFNFSPAKNYDDYILSYLKYGSTVTIFTTPQFLEKLGLAESNTIIKLVKENKIVVDHFKLVKEVSFNMFLVCFPLFSGFFILYFIKTRRRYKRLHPFILP